MQYLLLLTIALFECRHRDLTYGRVVGPDGDEGGGHAGQGARF